jgi:hypothetical protein
MDGHQGPQGLNRIPPIGRLTVTQAGVAHAMIEQRALCPTSDGYALTACGPAALVERLKNVCLTNNLNRSGRREIDGRGPSGRRIDARSTHLGHGFVASRREC